MNVIVGEVVGIRNRRGGRMQDCGEVRLLMQMLVLVFVYFLCHNYRLCMCSDECGECLSDVR